MKGILKMKTIILTGASSGLGAAIGKLCVKNGINVIAVCRTKPDYECDFIKTDLRYEESVLESCDIIKREYKEFDALINCAGIISIKNLDNLNYKEIEKVYRINSIAPVVIISNLLPLIKANGADILNVASIMGTLFDVESDSLTYSASKWAMRGASFNLEKELYNTPCRVITFNPGGMNTQLFRNCDESLRNITKGWMDPNDIADIVLYILNLPKQIEITEITITRKNI